jgi:transposase
MALSDDLRKRVVEAVVGGGLSRNAAARRFGVSIASAVRWVTRYKTTGNVSPSPSGGDRRSGRVEAQRDYLLGLIRRTPDITLLEIQERLIHNCGERFSVSVLWRFFDRHGVTFKKRPRTPRSSGARTFSSSAGIGSPPNSILIPRNSSSSTRPALPPISPESMDAAGADGACEPPLRTAITRRSPSLPVCACAGLRRRRSTTGR